MKEKNHPGLMKRLAVMLYDGMLLFGVLFFASLIVMLPVDEPETIATHLWYQVYLVVVCYLYFAYAWTRSGQTLGLKTWKLRVQQPDGKSITWVQSLIRFVSAIISWSIFGMGFLWILFDKNNMAWHDYLSKTEIIKLQE
ncbi:MAG: RDD family protein [Gammaproteobacteria bacterium]|nr:RDD family protein [Gammaproteobacteria bacterium]MDH5592913.1 RDD family protein [Gammaproteobacteria bacterium]